MSTEELLKPRYKAIADYPGNEIKVGEVMTNYSPSKWGNDRYDFTESKLWFDRYPHLFKPLTWWEERKPQDMPEYIKWHQDGVTKDVYKVLAWEQMDTYPRASIGLNEVCTMCLNVLPATEEEYLKHKQ